MANSKVKNILLQFKDLVLYIVFALALYFLLNTFLSSDISIVEIDTTGGNVEAKEIIESIENISNLKIDTEFINDFTSVSRKDFERPIIPISKGKQNIFE